MLNLRIGYLKLLNYNKADSINAYTKSAGSEETQKQIN